MLQQSISTTITIRLQHTLFICKLHNNNGSRDRQAQVTQSTPSCCVLFLHTFSRHCPTPFGRYLDAASQSHAMLAYTILCSAHITTTHITTTGRSTHSCAPRSSCDVYTEMLTMSCFLSMRFMMPAMTLLGPTS